MCASAEGVRSIEAELVFFRRDARPRCVVAQPSVPPIPTPGRRYHVGRRVPASTGSASSFCSGCSAGSDARRLCTIARCLRQVQACLVHAPQRHASVPTADGPFSPCYALPASRVRPRPLGGPQPAKFHGKQSWWPGGCQDSRRPVLQSMNPASAIQPTSDLPQDKGDLSWMAACIPRLYRMACCPS
jgi:hypothetical protein